MTTQSHSECTHPSTKAARARCRKNRLAIAAMWAEHEAENARYHETYVAPFLAQQAAAEAFEKACEIFADAHVSSAHQNADDTSVEESFEMYSTRWYQVALSTLEHARDNAVKVFRADDAEKGQALQIKGGTDWVWVDAVEYAGTNGWPTGYTVVDRAGKRSKITPEDIDLNA